MAFNAYAQAAKDNSVTPAPTANDGPQLEEIQTTGIGLPALNGEVKLKIFDAWPEDSLPPPTSSLLAVASTKGLLAAAGPNELVLTSTDQVRTIALERREKETSPVRDYQPNLRIPRAGLAHVAFTADDSALLVSAQNGGGLDAYSVSNLEKAEPAISISTDGKALRSMVPNPAPEPDLIPLVALVTVDGELLLADLKQGAIRRGQNGSVLRTGVSCVTWSPKGKALVAGLGDGTAVQLKPDGQEMALIPKLATMDPNYYVSAMSWLQNDSFLFVYANLDTEFPPSPCEYYIIDREPKTTNYLFKRLTEPLPLMGMERLPTSHLLVRLRNFPPSLTDLVLVAATSSTEVGLITKAGQSLSAEAKADEFASTLIADENRRAVLPLSSSGDGETSPVGMALDFSSTELVRAPVPEAADIDETSHSVPQLLILNNEGLLCSWWILYSESVLQKTQHPAMRSATAAEQELGQQAVQNEKISEQMPQPAASFAAPASTFGQASFGTPATTGTAPTPPFASTGNLGGSSAGAFGTGSSSFGGASTIGGAKSSWVSTGFSTPAAPQSNSAGFGQPAFGSASSFGNVGTPGFGAPSALGKPSFGQTSTAPAFGTSGFGAKPGGFGNAPSSASPFGNANTSTKSPFGAFASNGSNDNQKPASPFGQVSGGGFASKDTEKSHSPFGQVSSNGFGDFGQGSKESVFGKAPSPFPGAGASEGGGSVFGKPGSFQLQSSFKADPTQKEDSPPPEATKSGFGFGSGFGDMLGSQQHAAPAARDKEENMSEETDEPSQTPFAGFSPENQKQTQQSLVTPPSTIGQPKATPAPPVSSLFGKPAQQTTTPQPAPPTSTGWNFGSLPTTTPKENAPDMHSTTPKDTPAPTSSLFGQGPKAGSMTFSAPKDSTQESPKIKEEPDSDDTGLKDIPEAPLPPDAVSKPRYVSGESSASSSNSRSTARTVDDPLPPDWTPANRSAAAPEAESSKQSPHSPAGEEAPLPPDPTHKSIPEELAQEPELPSEEDDLSEFDESSDEEDDDENSPIEATNEDGEEQIATSPESSFKSGERSTEASPTGGLFTKVNNTTSKPRPLFGEVGTNAPIFAPPKPQESPRSPSPVRNILPTDRLRFEASRSVSAPADRRSMIDQRKEAYAQSGLAAQAQQAQQQELARHKQREDEARFRKSTAESQEYEDLEDDDDERLREELQSPIQASETLDDFVTYQAKPSDEGAKSGVPAQIERLYRDINSMVDTFGINLRSLGAYMKHQQEQQPNKDWPQVLASETPVDALNDEWYLQDIMRLRDGQTVLDDLVDKAQVYEYDMKLHECQQILSQDIMDLKMKSAAIRKSLSLRSKPEEAATAPLSSEQSSLQHELRVSSANVQGKLVQVEDALAVLRAKVLESWSSDGMKRTSLFGAATPKKPTIEAVTNTVMKMTKMAEQKSADVDLLEAQLRKLDVKGGLNGSRHGTPNGTSTYRRSIAAASPSSSVYLTPNSKFGGSTKSTPARRSVQGPKPVISAEDSEKWRAKAQRKKAVASLFRDVLEERKQNRIMSRSN